MSNPIILTTKQNTEKQDSQAVVKLRELVSYLFNLCALKKDIPRTVSALPTAGSTYTGQMFTLLGAAGVHDHLYVCLKSASDTYSWVLITDGGA